MATETATPPVAQDEERSAKEWKRAEEERKRAEERRILRERQLEEDLQDVDVRHQEERRALSQELRELADARKAIQDQLWADWISSSIPDQQRKLSAELPTVNRCLAELGEEEAASKLKYEEHEGGASSSTAGTALNGKEDPGERDKEISYCAESSWKHRQQQHKEKQALLRELLPAKKELRLELQHLLKDLEIKALRDVYEYRIKVEDPREIEAHHRTTAARRAGLWRFVSKKVEAKRRVVELMESAKDDIAYVDKQKLGYPKLPECFEEIKKRFDIEQNPFFSKTLHEWKQEKEMLILQEDRIHNRVASVKNEVYQVIGFFSVFQGVLLTAVAQSSLLHCHNKWSPIVLSVLASVISTFGVIQKWNQIIDLQIMMDSVTRVIATAEQAGQRLQKPGLMGINFVHLNAEIKCYYSQRSELLKNNRDLAWLYFVLFISTMVAFALLFPISFWRILCKPGSPPAP